MRPLRLRQIGPAIFVVSWLMRIAIVLSTGSYRQPVIPVETVLIARGLAAGRGFSDPYSCVTGPTAHLAPVFPYVLSILYRVFPPGGSRELAVYIFSATAVSLAYALLPWLAIRWRLDYRTGILAGLAGALVPLFFWTEVESQWEAPLSALLLLIALGTFADLFERTTILRAVRAGIVWGVALLTAPTLLFVFVALFAALVWNDRRQIAAWRRMIALGLPVVLLIAPWTIRNYQVFHRFILIRGNAGLQLHMSFNDQARATFEEGALSGAFVDHPYTTRQACAEFARFGEIEMNRRYEQEALQWIYANPGRSARLVEEHFVAFWRMAVPSPAKTVASEFLTLCALLGLWRCFKRHWLAARLTGIVLLTYPLVYYVNFFDVRYRYPLHPIMLLLACVFVTETVRIGILRFRWSARL